MIDSLLNAAILWLPSTAFFTTVIYRAFLYPQSKLDSAYWKFPESSALPLWIPILVLQIYALAYCGKQLLKIKVTIFWSLLLTSLAIRCLTLLSALCSSEGYEVAAQMQLIFSTSPIKPLFLSILCNGPISDWVRLGRYDPYAYDDTPKPATDIFSFLNCFNPDDVQVPRSWRDLVVRLGYVHAIDNFIHVIWLRHLYENGPYTAHVNNSELFTLMLIVQMALYIYAERSAFGKHECEVEAGVVKDEKAEAWDVV